MQDANGNCVCLSFQVFCEEIDRALPGIGCVGGAIAVFVVAILKGVSGIVVDFDFNLLSQLLELFAELTDIGGGNPFVLGAKNVEDGGVNFLERFRIGCQMTVADEVGSKRGATSGV